MSAWVRAFTEQLLHTPRVGGNSAEMTTLLETTSETAVATGITVAESLT